MEEMIRTYHLPGLPPTVNDRFEPGLTRKTHGFSTVTKPRIYTTSAVKQWALDVTKWMLPQKPECLSGDVAVSLMFRLGDNRKDVDGGIKDVLDALQARKLPAKYGGAVDTRGALYLNDRQVAALFVVKDRRKGPLGVDIVIGTLAEAAQVAREIVALAEDIAGVKR